MIRFLLVDDEINVLKSLKRVLLRWLRPTEVVIELYTDPLEALKRSEEEDFHIVIADYRMPGMNGIELLARIKVVQPDAIRLMLSATSDFDVLLEAVNTVEIFHYIKKPWSAEEIKEIVQKSLARRDSIINERKRIGTTQPDPRTVDALTGLSDRTGFRQELADVVAKDAADSGILAVLFLGLDHFRSINNLSGNHIGDLVLRRTAERIRQLVPSSGIVARVGGDEFALALPNLVDKQDAGLIAKSLVEAISEPLLPAHPEVRTGASIGIAFYAHDIGDLDRLLQEGEDAMHYVKDHGGGTWQLHSPEVDAYSRRHVDLHAQNRERFESLTAREREVLQMLISGKTNKMIAYTLGISNRTVENHRARIMEKTQAKSLPELVRMAWQQSY